MKIVFISVGKKDDPNISELIRDYTKRIERYFETEWKIISSSDVKKEAVSILGSIKDGDFVIALDKGGKDFSTEGLADFFEKKLIDGEKRIIFIIGGAYGFDKAIFDRADFVWSLSKLTFPHQIVRLILVESIYRAISVIKREPYHHT